MGRLSAAVCFLLLTGVTMAITLTVDDDGPADHPSIQSAINAAGNGDEIVVQPGRYRETLNFLGKSITVRSDQGPANTLVYLEGETRIVLLNGDSTLRGFTISGGGSQRIGGGIYVTNGAQAVIEDNVIENNTANWNGVLPGVGGGIAVDLGSDPTITRNVIRRNLAAGDALGLYGYGGGIHLADYTTATITNNVVVENQATAAGGGIYLGITGSGYSSTVTNNTIVGNRAGQDGSTILPEGGGIEVYDGFAGPIRNGLIAGNQADQGGGIYFVGNGTQGIDFESNDFDANVPDDCLGLSGTKCVSGQFFLPALMQNPGGDDYRLRSDSSLIDLGTATGAPALDRDGRTRPADGNLDGVAAPDIGAFENQGEITRLRFDSKTLLSWDGSTNGAMLFDVYRDDLSTLAPGPLGSCWQPGLGTTSVSDGTTPVLVGDGFFYLVGGRATATGTLGYDGAGAQRMPATGCP